MEHLLCPTHCATRFTPSSHSILTSQRQKNLENLSFLSKYHIAYQRQMPFKPKSRFCGLHSFRHTYRCPELHSPFPSLFHVSVSSRHLVNCCMVWFLCPGLPRICCRLTPGSSLTLASFLAEMRN